MANCILLLACLLFSFACNLIRKIYDNQTYSSTTAMIQNAFISGLAGFFFSLILNEFILSPILTVILSGIGGFFGIRGLEFIIHQKIGNDLQLENEFRELINVNANNQQTINSINTNDNLTNTNSTNTNSNLTNINSNNDHLINDNLTNDNLTNNNISTNNIKQNINFNNTANLNDIDSTIHSNDSEMIINTDDTDNNRDSQFSQNVTIINDIINNHHHQINSIRLRNNIEEIRADLVNILHNSKDANNQTDLNRNNNNYKHVNIRVVNNHSITNNISDNHLNDDLMNDDLDTTNSINNDLN